MDQDAHQWFLNGNIDILVLVVKTIVLLYALLQVIKGEEIYVSLVALLTISLRCI
jgi:hypothetical protein